MNGHELRPTASDGTQLHPSLPAASYSFRSGSMRRPASAECSPILRTTRQVSMFPGGKCARVATEGAAGWSGLANGSRLAACWRGGHRARSAHQHCAEPRALTCGDTGERFGVTPERTEVVRGFAALPAWWMPAVDLWLADANHEAMPHRRTALGAGVVARRGGRRRRGADAGGRS